MSFFTIPNTVTNFDLVAIERVGRGKINYQMGHLRGNFPDEASSEIELRPGDLILLSSEVGNRGSRRNQRVEAVFNSYSCYFSFFPQFLQRVVSFTESFDHPESSGYYITDNNFVIFYSQNSNDLLKVCLEYRKRFG